MNSKPKISATELAEQFRAFIDPDFVITDDETMKPYECDGMSMYCEMPMLVVLPETAEQVQRVMRLCNEHEVPVVARGAGTGLSAGAMPHKEGVVLSLAKFNRILDIDPLARTALLQPGVRNLAISEEVAQYGLYYGPDPSSQIACTIGGNVAENSGGVHCLKYGLTVHNILSVEMITAEGDRVTRSIVDHMHIIEAIESRDAGLACELVRDHTMRLHDHVRKSWHEFDIKSAAAG